MPRRTTVPIVLAAIVAAGATATDARAQNPPGIPGLPSIPDLPKQDVERFALNVDGIAREQLAFRFDPIPDVSCGFYSEGTIKETWTFRRRAGVVVTFQKFGGKVFLGREGRSPGDTAFEAQGELVRKVTGFVQALVPPSSCPSTPLMAPTCNVVHKTPSKLRLNYASGKFLLESAYTANNRRNPAESCGETSRFNFGQELRAPYPALTSQAAALPGSKIFGNARRLRLALKPKAIGVLPPDGAGFTQYDQTSTGSSDVTLIRLAAKKP